MLSVNLRITGKVQGVFYRASTMEKATSLQLAGWVRNEVDGSVTAHVQGPKSLVDQLIEWAWQGPKHAQVSDVHVAEVEPANVTGFTIRE